MDEKKKVTKKTTTKKKTVKPTVKQEAKKTVEEITTAINEVKKKQHDIDDFIKKKAEVILKKERKY